MCIDSDGDGPGACCEHDFGLDPKQVSAACGFTAYLGERRDVGACSRIFKRGEAEVRLRVEDLDGLSWDAAVALQESGLGPAERVSSEAIAGDRTAHWTRGANETWLLVPGWSRPRRIAWPTDACPDEAIAQVAGAMASAPERAPVRPVASGRPGARPLPEPSADGVGGSLLAEYAARTLTASEGPRTLPANAKAIVVELLTAAAKDDLASLAKPIAPKARWGNPDRRELDAHPVFAEDGGASFLEQIRLVASRFSPKENLHCPPVPSEKFSLLESGEQPMWCFYLSEDKLDVMTFRMRMYTGAAKIDYIGFQGTRPVAPIVVDSTLPVPPMVPAAAPGPLR